MDPDKKYRFLNFDDNNAGRLVLYGLFSVLIVFQVFVLLFSTGSYGGADNIGHFQIAKFSFKYPKLLLDLWGKPVYSILLAPFTLFGFTVAKAFNILVFIAALFLTAKIAQEMLRSSWSFIVLLAAFSPVYYYLATTCLTEMLFSLFLVASVYLFFKGAYLWSAILISFIPFVRTEGLIFLPVFAIAFILRQHYKFIFVLATGTLFYTIIGFFVYKDLFWLIHQMPYSLGESAYGKGPLLHFIDQRNEIFGLPLVILIVPGLIFWIYQIIKEKSNRSEQLVWFILIAGCWTGYFAAHSYVWWKGTGGSLGLIRVIGGVIPLAALTAVKSFECISVIGGKRILTYTLMAVFALAQVIWFFRNNEVVVQADPTDLLIEKSSDYIRFNEAGKKVFYFNPWVVHYLDLNPYDIKQCNWLVEDRLQPSSTMEWGDILVWDAHFGPNEGGVQLAILEKDPYLKRIKSFYPVEKVTVLGGYDYSVQVYEKSRDKNDSVVVSDRFEKELSFEEYVNDKVREVDGYKVWVLDSSQEFSPNILLTPDAVKQSEILEITCTLHYKALEPLPEGMFTLVFSAENDGKSFRYETADLVSVGSGWEQIQLHVKMSANIPEESRMLFYIWNLKRKRLLMRDLKVEIKSY